jgi:hypothetical protein
LFETYNDIVNIDDLMEMLDIGKNYAYDLLRSGQIKSFKICVQQYILSEAALKQSM